MVVLWGGAGCYEQGTPVERAEGYLTHMRQPPPQDHHRALGIVVMKGPRGGAVSYERGTPVDQVRVLYNPSTFQVNNCLEGNAGNNAKYDEQVTLVCKSSPTCMPCPPPDSIDFADW